MTTGSNSPLDAVLSALAPYKNISVPLEEALVLWQGGGCIIAISDEWGPPVPYPPARRQNGSMNQGYVSLKRNPGAISQIPEVADCPELEQLLRAANCADSPIESVGCEKAYASTAIHGQPGVSLGSYVNLIFTEPGLNDLAENHALLACTLANAVSGCDHWWSRVEIELEKFKGIAGAGSPWGLLVRVNGDGRSQEEARKLWAESLARITTAIAQLPRDFRWSGSGLALQRTGSPQWRSGPVPNGLVGKGWTQY